MKIEKFSLSKVDTQTEGIEPINMNRLGSVVALVGRNGSGKSRILRLLQKKYLRQLGIINLLDGSVTNPPKIISNYLDDIIRDNKGFKIHIELKALQKQLPPNPKDDILRKKVNDLSTTLNNLYPAQVRKKKLQQLDNLEKSTTKIIREYFPKYIRRIDSSEIRQLQLAIEEAGNDTPITFESLIESVDELAEYNEFKTIHRTALEYLSKLPHQLVYDFDDCYGDNKKFQSRVSYKRYSSLKKFIKNFLNKGLEWKKEKGKQVLNPDGVTTQSIGTWKLNGRKFNYSEFSEGEKTLFAYSLLFFLLEQNPNIRIKESLIIIDEPELHLHPESELAVINGIRNVIGKKGQLWIATHSINILSDLAYDEIFLVKNNSIIPPSRTTPSKSFNELMGLEEHIERLKHFVVDISNWSFLNFITQCFNDPEVIKSARRNDPEVDLFKKIIAVKKDGSVLLDFGAGRGRIFKEFSDQDIQKKQLQYYALEPDKQNIEELKKLNFKHIYKKYAELPSKTFDFILLCNVLHELPITEWVSILSKIIDSLKDDGFIILIEDICLPKGEKVGTEGFLILDMQSLKELFSLTDLPGQLLSHDERYKDRILCALINKQNIVAIDDSTIIKSLETLQKNTMAKIKEIRKTQVDELNKLSLGRESAFYSQLFINSLLAVEKLKNKK